MIPLVHYFTQLLEIKYSTCYCGIGKGRSIWSNYYYWLYTPTQLENCPLGIRLYAYANMCTYCIVLVIMVLGRVDLCGVGAI